MTAYETTVEPFIKNDYFIASYIDGEWSNEIPGKNDGYIVDKIVCDNGATGTWDNEEWGIFEEKLKSLPITNKEARQFVRFFLAGAAEVEVDKQGRILVPNVLREFAELNKDVVLIGVASRIEIWSKERFEGMTAYEDMDEIAEHMAELGLGI